jgi:hypothetical protein
MAAPGRSILAVFVVTAALTGGCNRPAADPSKVTVRLLGSAPSRPGEPIALPGSELVGAQKGQKHIAAYVWFDVRKGGAPLASMGNDVFVEARYSDGWSTSTSLMVDRNGIAVARIPAGYSAKPSYVDLEVTSNHRAQLGTFRIKDLAQPIRAIREDEPQMPDPRWSVAYDQNSHLRVRMDKLRDGLTSTIRLNRGTYLDLGAMDRAQMAILTERQQPSILPIGAVPYQSEVELEETQYAFVEERCQVVVRGATIEEVFEKPVINIPASTSVTSPSGIVIQIPKQRIASHRAGSGTSRWVEIRIKADAKTNGFGSGPGDPLRTSYSVLSVNPNLGEYGISELRIVAEGSVGSTGNFTFSDRAESIKTGSIPKITITILLKVPIVVGTYKGIVSVDRAG